MQLANNYFWPRDVVGDEFNNFSHGGMTFQERQALLAAPAPAEGEEAPTAGFIPEDRAMYVALSFFLLSRMIWLSLCLRSRLRRY